MKENGRGNVAVAAAETGPAPGSKENQYRIPGAKALKVLMAAGALWERTGDEGRATKVLEGRTSPRGEIPLSGVAADSGVLCGEAALRVAGTLAEAAQ